MKKNNSTNLLLILGVVLSFFCSFFLGNLILGLLVFIVILGFVVYIRRASFLGSRATTAYEKKDIEKSFELYEKAIAVKNCPDMVKIVYAYRLINEGQVDKCAHILGSIDTTRMNENEKLNYNATHALTVWKQGSLHRAIEIYEALLNEKESLLIYETLGYLILCSKNYNKALSFNLKALEFNDTSKQIRDNLAGSYYYLGYHKKAAKLYKELIEENVNFPEPYYYYALILNEREKYKSALKYLNMALEKKESHLSQLKHSDVQYMIEQINEYLQYLETLDDVSDDTTEATIAEPAIVAELNDVSPSNNEEEVLV